MIYNCFRKIFPAIVGLAAAIIMVSCHHEQHFITDADYRAQVEKDFEARKTLAAGCADELFSVMDTSLSLEETE
ncbi:MAG: hypothetical protein J6T33_05390, partial [Bacteroidales bacterium]|nr:hypothetical protein [Bacteroidales bacterium]